MVDVVRNSLLDAIAFVTKHVIEVVQFDAVALIFEPVLPASVRACQSHVVVPSRTRWCRRTSPLAKRSRRCSDRAAGRAVAARVAGTDKL